MIKQPIIPNAAIVVITGTPILCWGKLPECEAADVCLPGPPHTTGQLIVQLILPAFLMDSFSNMIKVNNQSLNITDVLDSL